RGCGILAADASLYCWGIPFSGQSGPFDRCERTDKVGPTNYKFVRFRCGEIPRHVLPGKSFSALAGGCALSTDGVIYCPTAQGLTPVETPERFKGFGGG